MGKHKVFISYHHADQKAVDDFVKTFDEEKDVFITRALGLEMEQDIINSNNPDYVMKRIRELYLKDSMVTIVLMGKCTWSRRYVDWEIQASLRHGESVTPNGLLGIKLPNFKQSDYYPNRLNLNLKAANQPECYARVIDYPMRKDTLERWIDDAFNARTLVSRTKWINNPRERFEYNRSC